MIDMPTTQITEAARDPRDEAPYRTPKSGSASPYTLNPPIDFDGLSWPSVSSPAGLDNVPCADAGFQVEGQENA